MPPKHGKLVDLSAGESPNFFRNHHVRKFEVGRLFKLRHSPIIFVNCEAADVIVREQLSEGTRASFRVRLLWQICFSRDSRLISSVSAIKRMYCL